MECLSMLSGHYLAMGKKTSEWLLVRHLFFPAREKHFIGLLHLLFALVLIMVLILVSFLRNLMIFGIGLYVMSDFLRD